MRIVALDFETSGTDPRRHAPVTLGVALMENGIALEQKEWLFAPPYDKTGSKITREYDLCAMEISSKRWPEIKRDGTPCATVLMRLQEFAAEHGAGELPIVAFNASFDLAFYSECLFMGGSWNNHLKVFEVFKPPLAGPWHCARMMALRGLSLERYDLDTVSAHYGITRTNGCHSAIEDAILAGRIYHELTSVKVAA